MMSDKPIGELSPDAAQAYAKTIVEAAYNLSGIELDYSVESLSHVDDLIEGFRGEGLSADDLYQTLVSLGCYVGEVLIRNNDGVWKLKDRVTFKELSSFPIVIQLYDGTVCNPIGKTFKRMMSGPEDSLVWFYSVVTRAQSESGQGET